MWSPEMKTLHVGLSTQRVVLATQRGLWRSRVTTCETLACEAAVGEPWRATVEALAHWLAQERRKALAVRVVLSERFVRWQLLPYREELSGAAEMQAFAALRFQEVYGKAAEHWQVQLTCQPPMRATPACAIDTALIDALRTACEAAGARLVAVTPYFSAAFDRWHTLFDRKAAWFGLVEPDCLTLALVQGGQWLGLHTQAVPGSVTATASGWRDLLPGLMTQLGLQSDLVGESPAVFLAGDANKPEPMAQLPWSWLQPASGGGEAGSGWRLALGV